MTSSGAAEDEGRKPGKPEGHFTRFTRQPQPRAGPTGRAEANSDSKRKDLAMEEV